MSVTVRSQKIEVSRRRKRVKYLGAEFCSYRIVRWRWVLGTLFIAISLSSSGCAPSGFAPPVDKSAESSIDRHTSRILSDSVADALIQGDGEAIEAKFEKDFRKSISRKEFDSTLSEMSRVYGKPLEFEFKQDELGSKSYVDGKIKPVRKFWYAAKTTKYEKGSYFLIVEVVPDDGGVAVSSFSIVNFPYGIPPNLM